ncbi:hypothetical protein GNI_117060 [Gregarina niphandrodes]|uniref:Uncharacterized protein n=1 Tax=Gregarina niphandrodes TaxID=110365 RepID=A0A023B2T3_GRENI|nr:hypothetical protein GNI_117060 [Gregarina niphandrodes]EZG55147.1 hypothetical protein GNI_117060 [Gregarina niphandrodes]|eukprot:XP_011131757.1 hypothetical protein GNI_117060 [Gregarina niphandrodes]
MRSVLDEITAEDRDFIDDGSLDEMSDDESRWRQELRDITGYDPSKFANMPEEEARESTCAMITYEERISERIARKEDLEEFKKAQEMSDDEDDDDE